ncbi:hypothetical protein [Streptomyces sp. P9-A2]|uniref:hypothetical protein n=1 Tax=Streptomyces sp. P9-A2 TaxID=3072284 RepID=UPI002FC7B94C
MRRDRVRTCREYARAGSPVYVIVDDSDDEGAVLVLTSPRRQATPRRPSTRTDTGFPTASTR